MSTASHQDLANIEQAIEGLNRFPGRAKTKDGGPGGLIELAPDAVAIVVGDLHTNLEHFKMILAHDGNLEAMRQGQRVLILVGDLIHDEQTGKMKDMNSSVDIFQFLMGLMAECPQNIIYLRGNHDTFDERLVKSGIFQGKEFKTTLLKRCGQEYVDATARLFDALPVFVIGQGFVVTHAGPVRGGVTRDELIHIHQHPAKLHQLVWNRAHEFRGTPSQKEYGAKDVELCLARLELKADTLFIVGHNPLWGTGEKTGVWLDAVEIKNHHILYSGYGSKAPYFLIRKGVLETRFAAEGREKEDYQWTR